VTVDDVMVGSISPVGANGIVVRGGLVRLAAAAAVVLMSAGLWLPGGFARAAAQDGQPVGDAQAVTLASDYAPPPGVRQLLPLGGVAFVAPSISAGFFSHVDGSEGSFVAAQPGDELLFLSVDAYSFAPPFGQTPYHYAAPQLSVTFGGHTVALTETPDGTVSGVAGSGYGDDGAYYPGRWVVALPKGAPVQLVATENGFSQTLDLRTGLRVGSSPAVLYRDQSGPLGLDLRPNLAGTLVVDAGGNRVTFPVTLQEATLNYFNLQSPDATAGANADQAWLFVEVSFGVGVDQSGRPDWYFDPAVPTHALSVSFNGGPAIAPTQGPPPPDPTDTSTHFKGLYGFVVPASVTSAAITVSSGTDPSVYYEGPDDLSPRAEPVSSSTPANFSVSFPAPNPATLTQFPPAISPPASTSPSPGADQPVSLAGGATSRGRGAAGGGWGDIGVGAGAGAGVVVLIIGGLFISRRTRLVEARPVKPDEDATYGLVEPAAPGLGSADAAKGFDHLGGPTAAPVADAPVAVAVDEAALHVPGLPRLRVHLIGPLEVEGTLGSIRRIAVLRILLVLALNLGRPISAEELRNRLATSDDSEPAAPTVRSELSRLRRVLPDGLLPEREPGFGYSLPPDDVDVDWFTFKTLVAQSESSAGEARLEFAVKALRLVRGPVLENRSWHGVDPLRWDMTAEIDRIAFESAALALDCGHPALAAELTRMGLAGVPGSPGLWRLRVSAAACGSGENVDQLKRRAKEDTGDEGFDAGDA
jgi:hypothetical protein